MKLILTGAFEYRDRQIEKIRQIGFDTHFIQNELSSMPQEMYNADAIICNNIFLHNDIKLFTNLKYIQLTSAGTDRVPMDYITSRGIILKTAGGVYAIPMAEWAVSKILELYKCSHGFYEAQQRKEWEKNRAIRELAGSTVAIAGFGNVGRQIAKRLKSFDVKILAIDLYPTESELADECFVFSDIDRAISESDIVVLSLPLTGQTRRLFNEERFAKMKQGAVLINIARGELVDEDALVRALDNGTISGAALDVFENEPLLEGSPLWERKNVIVTPHNSFASEKVNERLFELILCNLAQSKVDR